MGRSLMKDKTGNIRLAFLIPTIEGGGAERFAVTMCDMFSQDPGYEVALLTSGKKDGEYTLNSKTNRVNILTGTFLKDVKRLHNYLEHWRADLCVAIDIYANLCGAMARMTHQNSRYKVILCERTAPGQIQYSAVTKAMRFFLFRFGDFFVFQTKGARNFYAKTVRKRSRIIPNPLRTDLPMRTDVQRKEIVAAGRLEACKNYPLLIQAFDLVYQKHPEYRLRIFGEGKERERLLRMIKRMKSAKHITLEGFCLDVHEKIKDSDIYVLSSSLEGMPNALLEAMAMGFPVVATDCPAGGCRDLTGENECGLLVPSGDKKRLAAAILTYIENQQMKQDKAQKAYLKSRSFRRDRIKASWETVFNLTGKSVL